MTNVYQLEVRTMCPIAHRETDVYQVTVESESMIEVELIVAFFKSYSKKQIYQEELTQRAATALGARVETVGIHSGVTVRSVAP